MRNVSRRVAAVFALLCLFALAAFASQTSITPIQPVGPYPSGGAANVSATALDLTFTAADTTNGNSFPLTGHEVLIAWNTDSASHTITISGADDPNGRSDALTSYAVGAGVHSAFSFLSGVAGWQQSDTTVHFSANSTMVKFCILYVPR